MYHLQRINLRETTKETGYRKSFTLVELIVSLAIGVTLIVGTYNVLSQSIATINTTAVAGTMDNYANRIQNMIRKEVISAKYINLSAMKNPSNTVTVSTPDGPEEMYKNLFYMNEEQLSYGIIYDSSINRVSVNFYPELNNSTSPLTQDRKEIGIIFNEEDSKGVKLIDIKWSLKNYDTSIESYNNPDYSPAPSKLLKYQVTLRKNYTNGKKPLEKTYFFQEVLECTY